MPITRGGHELRQLEERMAETILGRGARHRLGERAAALRRPLQAEVRPHHPDAHQRGADDEDPGDGEHAIPVDRDVAGIGHRRLDLEHAIEQRDLQQLGDLRRGPDDREAPIQPLRGRVPANQRSDAGAVGPRHATAIEHDVPISLPEQVLHAAFEFFGWAAGHEILLRRKHEP